MTNLETAMSHSPDNSAINFGLRGWILVEERDGYQITTEDRPSPPRHYDSLEAVQKAVRLFDKEAWEPYENKFD